MTRNMSQPKRVNVFRREDHHEFRYQLSVFCAGLLSWIAFLIPSPIRRRIAMRCGMAFYRLSNTYRSNVESNVRQVLGEGADGRLVRATARSIFRNSALNFLELLTLPRRSRRYLVNATVVVEGDFAMINNAIATGRGVIFISGHIGCFDFIGQSLEAHGIQLTVVTGRTTSRFIFDGVTWLRGARGGSMVEPTPGGVVSVVRTLRKGGCAVFIADRDFFQNGREVSFFGQPTTLPPGPVRLARETGSIVIPIFSRRAGRVHEIRILEPMVFEKTPDVEADMDAGMQRMATVLEEGISSTLDQWAMFQRVWPERPPSAVRVFPVGSPLESELLERVANRLPELPERKP